MAIPQRARFYQGRLRPRREASSWPRSVSRLCRPSRRAVTRARGLSKSYWRGPSRPVGAAERDRGCRRNDPHSPRSLCSAVGPERGGKQTRAAFLREHGYPLDVRSFETPPQGTIEGRSRPRGSPASLSTTTPCHHRTGIVRPLGNAASHDRTRCAGRAAATRHHGSRSGRRLRVLGWSTARHSTSS
jgi:hypothetical protein